MTLLVEPNMQASSNAPADALTVWGYSPSALHDLFWLSREVAVVRPGSTEPLPPHARLFMLVPAGKLFRVHLRLVLDQLFWTPRAMYLIGLNSPAPRRAAPGSQGKIPSNDQPPGSPASAIAGCVKDCHAAARMAITPHREIAEYWRTSGTMDNVWMRLRRQYPDFGSIRVPGIAYASDGCQAVDYLRALTRDWPEPEAAIAGITRLAHHVHGPIGFDMSILNNKTRPLWIGKGADGTASTANVIPDAVSPNAATQHISARK